MRIQQSTTAYALTFFMVDSTDHITGKTGLSPTVTLSKNGAAFGAVAGAVTEISSGWYKVAGNATDGNTLGALLLHATAAGADPSDREFEVVIQDLTTATIALVTTVTTLTGNTAQTGDTFARIGLLGVGLTQVALVGSAGIKKNTAKANFMFLMTDSTTHLPKTGLTVTPKRSLDGAAFAAGTLSAVTEVSDGWYRVDLAAGDLNGNTVALLFTATGADSTNVSIVTGT